MAPVLQVVNQRTAFVTARGLLQAVDGVSFILDKGQTLGIVGESGSGKSVLSRSIMGLLPPNARTGPGSRVVFEGADLSALTEREFRKLRGLEMAIVFQDPMTSLNPVLTIGSQITEVLTHHLGFTRNEAKERTVELLASVGLPQPETRANQYPHQLSGGMRQRVAIAIALACEPRLLIADEPTTALDVTVQAEILDLLQKKQREANMAMILITHDMGVVAGRTDKVAVMYAGRIVEQAPTQELFHNRRMPYTDALLASIPRMSDDNSRRLNAIDGRPPDLIDRAPGCSFEPRCVFADGVCTSAAPPLSGTDHAFACWHPIGADATT